ncbi:MAG TPA: G/U mismatch-specific DNA glycosylase [Candidatus Methylomirabilis sp.]|nr:G/U mismatch-specific DNA glycosylase [Candidatus Methylomirabilis sp.]
MATRAKRRAPHVEPRRPSKVELLAARNKTVPDVIAPGLRVLFVGINPGLYSGAVRHHFARPGNRFWPALHKSGFTPRLLTPYEECELLKYGGGITNLVNRATANAAELMEKELRAGAARLTAKIRRYRPRVVAVLGVGAFRAAFHRDRIHIGEQPETIGNSKVWVLPNPSGLNANYQLPELARLFRMLHGAAS